MGSTKSGFRWSEDQIRPSLKTASQKGEAYLNRVTTYHALRAEAYARLNAPWTDRSTNARGGLEAVAINRSGHHEIVLYHTMPYGIWLEIRFAGRYAIIRPTIRHEAPEYFETARELLDSMFGA
jgi:hypothetical protein